VLVKPRDSPPFLLAGFVLIVPSFELNLFFYFKAYVLVKAKKIPPFFFFEVLKKKRGIFVPT
jgi:hypothetical protein